MHVRRFAAAVATALALAWLVTIDARSAGAVGTAFTYQGRLLRNGAPVNGVCDLQFGLFTVPSNGAPIGSVTTIPDVTVNDGLFTVQIDFGGVFDSLGDRYLEIGSRCPGGTGDFTTLSPRQLITATPYALGLVLPSAAVVDSSTAAYFLTNTGSGSDAVLFKPFSPNPADPTLSASAGGSGAVAVRAESMSGAGVRGSTAGTSFAGVEGHATADPGGVGVLGQVDGANGTGVKGVANDGVDAKAIQGQSFNGFAGYFDGRVRVITGSSSEPDVFVVSVDLDKVARIDADGKGYFNGGTQTGGADVAEFIPAGADVEPGDVVEIDPQRPNHFRRADSANSTAVAGVISTEPGVSLNARDGARATVSGPQLALAGRVPVKVTAENGPIRPGDLLVASSTPGHAMRGPANPAPGTVIGKALTQLDEGVGVGDMLVMLR